MTYRTCAFIVVILFASLARGEKREPYTAFVRATGASVRSGPGNAFYATDRLEPGTKVHVYRHHQDRWAAIQPPPGSFSWIPAGAVKLSEESDLGRVINPQVRTRIGTRYGDKHDVEYVQLKRGEVVEILGTKELAEESATAVQPWFQISPPAGEFRWIRLSSLQLDPPPASETTETIDNETVLFADHANDGLSADDTHDGIDDHRIADHDESAEQDVVATQAVADELRPVPAIVDPRGTIESHPSDETPARSTKRTLPASRATSQDEQWQVITADELPIPESLFQPRADDLAPTRRTAHPQVLQDELHAIELRLAQIATQDPLLWDLGDLASRTKAVIDLSSTGKHREHGQRVLAKITQFEDLQRRYTLLANDTGLPRRDTLLAGTGGWGSIRTALDGIAPRMAQDSVQNPLPQYDGVGWLMPVVTRRQGVPRYALTDAQGNILHFVSAIPGLNLRSYERRPIAILGRKSAVSELNRPHLTAERVISLDHLR